MYLEFVFAHFHLGVLGAFPFQTSMGPWVPKAILYCVLIYTPARSIIPSLHYWQSTDHQH